MSFDIIVKAITSGISQFQWQDIVDILVLFVLLYNVILLTRETRAYQVLKGITVLFAAAVVSQMFSLTAISWMLNSLLSSGILVIVVLFQPELRRALEHIGRGKLFERTASMLTDLSEAQKIVSELQQVVLRLAKRRVGALIVIEQRTKLEDIVSTGTRIDGMISGALIENIFEPNTPLHDGAVILRDHIVLAASCFLPLSDESGIARELGTRHRAALGVSSVSDSITLIVSEETGVISFAQDGRLVRYLDAKALNDLLESIYIKGKNTMLPWFNWRGKNGKKA